MNREIDDLKAYINNPRPFELLEIDPAGKTITELYLELHFRAGEEFLEHCYRSKKNYTLSMFRTTIFHRRYTFLKRHLKELSYWLYRSEKYMPEELVEAMNMVPGYKNPWGVKVPLKQLKKNKYFGKDL